MRPARQFTVYSLISAISDLFRTTSPPSTLLCIHSLMRESGPLIARFSPSPYVVLEDRTPPRVKFGVIRIINAQKEAVFAAIKSFQLGMPAVFGLLSV